jgi:hypothetical protein
MLGADCVEHLLVLTSRKAAITALNTIQTNYAIVKAIRDSGRSMNLNAIPEMIEWLHKVGYQVDETSSPMTSGY